MTDRPAGSADGDESRNDDVDDVPLTIAGHEDRSRPGDDATTDGHATAGGDETAGGHATTDGGLLAEPGESADDGETVEPETIGGPEGVDESASATDEDATGDTDDSDDVEPVEVLVTLAEDGEIDPWDIDIVAVTDKFLDRIDEADLRTSGRALFYASVLLRMKGEAMLEEEDPDESDEPEPWERAMGPAGPAAGDGDGAWEGDGNGPDPGVDPFEALDEEMDRRLERKRARGMPQTLDELVRDLRKAERDNWWKESREYDTSDSPSDFHRGTQELDYRAGDDLRMDDEPTAADVTGTAHAENVDEIVADVHDALRDHYEQGRAEVLYREIETAGGSRVETFLGLLFLSHRGEVRLDQDELFGDLWIQDPTADLEPREAVAD